MCCGTPSMLARYIKARGREMQRASRLSGALSEAGTPRVAPARERSLPPDLRAFSLSFQGCPLACIELHTPADSPLQPGMTFSGTVDFRTTSAPGCKRVACRQVLAPLSAGVLTVALHSYSPPCAGAPACTCPCWHSQLLSDPKHRPGSLIRPHVLQQTQRALRW